MPTDYIISLFYIASNLMTNTIYPFKCQSHTWDMYLVMTVSAGGLAPDGDRWIPLTKDQ